MKTDLSCASIHPPASMPIASTSITYAPRVLILGDDLSGAADCAVTGAGLGLRSSVVLHQQAARQWPEPIDVLAIDLDCRRHSAKAAAQVHTDAWRAVGDPTMRLYKKVDSTLRGNVASEVAALTREIGMAIVAPAFPAAGRTTVNAHQLLHGVPLEETEVWRNEHIPGRADLLSMLSSAGLRTQSMSLQNVRSTPEHLTQCFKDAQTLGVQAVICDAQTEDDLQRIAFASSALSNVFWVGSAGLARELMTRLVSHELARSAEPVQPQVNIAKMMPAPAKRPVLAVVGSMSSVSHEQVAALREAAGEAMLALELDTDALLGNGAVGVEGMSSTEGIAMRAVAADVALALQAGRDVLVSLSQRDRTRVADGLLLCQALARLLAPVVPFAGSVIATGGETARALLAASGMHTLQVISEVEQGVPLMHVRLALLSSDMPARLTHPHTQESTPGSDNASDFIQVITKAGGFGTRQTLITAWRRVSGHYLAVADDGPLSFSGSTAAHGALDQASHKELTQ